MNQSEHRYSDPKLQEGQLDLGAVEKYIQSLGFSVVQLSQQWRHATGRIQDSAERDCFFKLASTEAIGRHTENETDWNNGAGRRLQESSEGLIVVPEIYSTGDYEGKFYYIGEYIEGETFPVLNSENEQNDTVLLRESLDSISKVAVALAQLECDEMWSAPQLRETDEIVDYYFREWSEWCEFAEAAPGSEQIIQTAEKIKADLNPRIAHGDFAIGAMLCLSEVQLALVDAEHAFSGWPAFYDIANMAHRLGTRDSVELAEAFLDPTLARLDEAGLNREDLLPALCYCSVRGFYEVNIDRQNELAKDRHRAFAGYLKDLLAA